MKTTNFKLIILCVCLFLSACHTQPLSSAAPPLDGAMLFCPPTPNCVSSDSSTADEDHWTPPLELLMPADTAWPIILSELESMPRTQVMRRTASEVHAEVKSRVFGFVDDVVLRREGDQVMLYSASRVGYSDLGVNRRRINRLREELQQKRVVR